MTKKKINGKFCRPLKNQEDELIVWLFTCVGTWWSGEGFNRRRLLKVLVTFCQFDRFISLRRLFCFFTTQHFSFQRSPRSQDRTLQLPWTPTSNESASVCQPGPALFGKVHNNSFRFFTKSCSSTGFEFSMTRVFFSLFYQDLKVESRIVTTAKEKEEGTKDVPIGANKNFRTRPAVTAVDMNTTNNGQLSALQTVILPFLTSRIAAKILQVGGRRSRLWSKIIPRWIGRAPQITAEINPLTGAYPLWWTKAAIANLHIQSCPKIAIKNVPTIPIANGSIYAGPILLYSPLGIDPIPSFFRMSVDHRRQCTRQRAMRTVTGRIPMNQTTDRDLPPAAQLIREYGTPPTATMIVVHRPVLGRTIGANIITASTTRRPEQIHHLETTGPGRLQAKKVPQVRKIASVAGRTSTERMRDTAKKTERPTGERRPTAAKKKKNCDSDDRRTPWKKKKRIEKKKKKREFSWVSNNNFFIAF